MDAYLQAVGNKAEAFNKLGQDLKTTQFMIDELSTGLQTKAHDIFQHAVADLFKNGDGHSGFNLKAAKTLSTYANDEQKCEIDEITKVD